MLGPALGFTESRIQWVKGVKLHESENDSLLSIGVGIKNTRTCIYSPQFVFRA
jgi:hypothetical protein